METIASINGAINGVVWGLPMLVLLVGAGIVLTIMNTGLQFRKFGYAMKNTGGRGRRGRDDALPGHVHRSGLHRRYR